jgi:hypothetical protein
MDRLGEAPSARPSPRRPTPITALLAATAFGMAAAAAPDCPCIDPWANPLDTVAGRAGPDARKVLADLPPDYGGAMCRPWDADVGDCKLPVPPAYCPNQWCYINASNCTRPHSRSSYFEAAHTLGALSYSYATCGFLNAYDAGSTLKAELALLQGPRALRVSFPGDSGSGFTLTTLAGSGKRGGSVAQFMARMLKDGGTEWREVPISPQSRARFASSYTACVHEVAINGTDLCIGNFWVTAERTLLASFTSLLYNDHFYLVTSAVAPSQRDTFLDNLSTPFRPLTLEAWACSLLAMMYVAVGMHLCETRKGYDTGGAGRPARATGVVAAAEEEDSSASAAGGLGGGKRKKQHDSPLKQYGRSLYLTLLGLFGGAPAHIARTGGGRVVNLGAGLFVVVLLAMFTAQLTTNLVSKAERGAVSSISDALESVGSRICVLESISASLVAKFPALADKYVPTKDAKEALLKMTAGACAHAVLDENSWANAQSGRLTPELPGSSRYHCDKVKVGDPVYAIGNAAPVREDIRFPISWKMTTLSEAGWYEDEVFSAKRKFMLPNKCGGGAAVERTGSLEVGQIWGPIVISVLCTTFGIVSSMVQKTGKKAARRLSSAVQQRRGSTEKEGPVPAARTAEAANTAVASSGKVTRSADTMVAVTAIA